MSRLGMMATLAGGVVLLVFSAGFFHAEKAPALAQPPVAKRPVSSETERCADLQLAGAPAPAVPPPPRGLMALTQSPAYKRAGDLSLRVADCTKAEDDLEAKLVTIKGEILDMVMEGTSGSRTCTLSVVIPADQFRGFIADLRKMGAVQSERITAAKLKPGQADKAAAVGEADPRELSLVSIRMADEKIAQTVLESRGILASSFDRSASHFLKGMAVMVELVGLALPFVLAFLALAVPVLVFAKLRRARASAM